MWSGLRQAMKNWGFGLRPRQSKRTTVRLREDLVNPSILTIALSEPDLSSVFRLAYRFSWRICSATSVAQALTLLAEERFPLILCNHDLLGRDWRDVLPVLAADCVSPSIILVSPVNDTNLWAEVIRRGGYDVISDPTDEPKLLSTLNMAWSYWRNHGPTSLRPI